MKTCNERECFLRASFRERLRWMIRLRSNCLAVFILLLILLILLMVCLIFARQPKGGAVIEGAPPKVGGNPKEPRSSPKENKYRTDFMFFDEFVTSELELQVYFFEFKNLDSFRSGSKPQLSEKGPYVYRLHRRRDKLYDDARKDEISFREYDTYNFDQVASGGLRETDNVTIVSTPYLQVIHWIQKRPLIRNYMVQLIDNWGDLLGSVYRITMRKKVRDVLFDGVYLCKRTYKHFVLRMLCEKLKRQVKQHGFIRPYRDQILHSILYHRNKKHYGTITINKGVLQESKAGLVTHYNGDAVMQYWLMNEPECNTVKGYLNTFPSKSKAATVIETFLPEICRTVKLEFAGTELVHDIQGYKFSAISSTFSNRDENSCFCTKKVPNFDGSSSCLYPGALDGSTCLGAPIVISFPHFLHADYRYADAIEGMRPEKSIHEIYLIVEPETGTLLKIVKRTQYNIFVPLSGNFTNVKSVLVPMLWMQEQSRLENGTEQWDRFVELPFPLNYSIRFFQVTNVDDVLFSGAKPKLNETEPYIYELMINKTNLKFDDADEDSVTYKREFSFEFVKTGNHKETDEITIVNPLLMAALQLVSGIERLALAGCLEKLLGPSNMNTIFIKQKVRNFLFDGITFAWSNTSGYACEIVRQKMIEAVKDVRVIEHITNDDGTDYLKIALLNYKTTHYSKESPDGIYTINRGIQNISALGDILRWNGKNTLKSYGNMRSTNNETCQTIRGTDSTIYHPELQKGRELYAFNTDICRTVELVYVSSDETYNGVKAFKYQSSDSLFRPQTLIPEHDCYCSQATQDASGKDSCYLDGLFDFQPCLGAPILVSQPHFLNADAKYLNGVSGLSPDRNEHGIYLLIEPNTGTPLEGMKRIQMNSVVRKQNLLSFITPDIMYEGIIPFFWLEEGFQLPQKYVDLLNDQYFIKVKIATALKYGLIAVSAALFAACLFIVWRIRYFKNKK